MTAMIIYNAKLINCRCTHIAVRICHQIRFVYGNPKFHLKTESEREQNRNGSGDISPKIIEFYNYKIFLRRYNLLSLFFTSFFLSQACV